MLHRLQQFPQAAGRGHRLGHQFDGAAAGKTKAVRFLGTDAVSDKLRAAVVNAFAARSVDDVVFDAAA
ncbi:hypothetical protein AWV80_34790 [Cupriavidus sp. UYMU48A]|nr:hypothetical protein AWV80_34790 [Cupriavidus sp. UYMU48A]